MLRIKIKDGSNYESIALALLDEGYTLHKEVIWCDNEDGYKSSHYLLVVATDKEEALNGN